MTLGIMHKLQKSADDDESTLASKLTDIRVIRSPKHWVPVAPQNAPRSNKKCMQLNVAGFEGVVTAKRYWQLR